MGHEKKYRWLGKNNQDNSRHCYNLPCFLGAKNTLGVSGDNPNSNRLKWMVPSLCVARYINLQSEIIEKATSSLFGLFSRYPHYKVLC